MVYMSGSRASRNTASITTRCQGGGSKLAGTAPRVGKDALLLSRSYDRAPNTTTTNRAFALLGPVCKNAGCGCDKAINSLACQSSAGCKAMFPRDQHPANGGIGRIVH